MLVKYFFFTFPWGKGKTHVGIEGETIETMYHSTNMDFFWKVRRHSWRGGGEKGGGFNVFPSCVSKKCNAEKGRMFVMVCLRVSLLLPAARLLYGWAQSWAGAELAGGVARGALGSHSQVRARPLQPAAASRPRVRAGSKLEKKTS